MKYRLFLILVIVIGALGTAQSYTNTFSASGGIFGDGYGGELAYNTNLSENTFTQLALNVTLTNYTSGTTQIPYSSYTASYSFFLTIYSRNRKMQALSIGAGALAGYEAVNGGNSEITNVVSVLGESSFIYGGVLSADLDIIISEHISLVLKTSQFYHVNSDFGNFTNYSGIGLRYYFNL
ncbi:conjugal transfer protein TraO [Maribacter sp. 2-571]|uniref:conjugal transfer protein TraO n=1 Tax=Maribacter sp. 2-571 TaxID=3417569 RepID=UPI003D353F74